MKVLSLFDGMSCGQLALQRAGIEVEEYYASEVDKYAIKHGGGGHPRACGFTSKDVSFKKIC